MPFYTYVLKSISRVTYYYGHTHDLQARIHCHNQGRVRSTKNRGPWEVHYFEIIPTKSEAYRRELFFKSFEGRNWLRENKII
jgi:putative endonuclease